MDRETIKQAIEYTLNDWLADSKVEHAYDINCGSCEDFAIDVLQMLDCPELEEYWIDEYNDEIPDDVLEHSPSHCVILWQDGEIRWYFDSECSSGVSDMREIPAIKNHGKTRAEVIDGS